jgi:hypothetical protein
MNNTRFRYAAVAIAAAAVAVCFAVCLAQQEDVAPAAPAINTHEPVGFPVEGWYMTNFFNSPFVAMSAPDTPWRYLHWRRPHVWGVAHVAADSANDRQADLVAVARRQQAPAIMFNRTAERDELLKVSRAKHINAVVLFLCHDLTDDDVAQLAKADKLEELRLFQCSGLTDASLQHVAGIETIRYLDVRGSGFTDKGLRSLRTLDDLRGLIWGVMATDDTCRLISQFKQLRHLVLMLSEDVSGQGLRSLARLQHLEELRLNISGVDREDLKELSHFEELKILDLSTATISREAAKGFSHCRKLESLYLGAADDAMAAVFQRLPALEELTINDASALSDDGLAKIAGLQKLRALRLLRCSRITAASLQRLAEMPAKDTLVLGGIQIEDAKLWAEFGGKVRAKRLWLDDCKSVGTDMLISVRDNAPLRLLAISRCPRVSQTEVRLLRAAVPALEVLWNPELLFLE